MKKFIANGVTSFFVLACACGAGAWTSTTNTTTKTTPTEEAISFNDNSQTFDKSDLLDESEEPILFFEGAEDAQEVDSTDLFINITKSTKTPTSQSYTASLASQITYYTGNTSNQWVYLALDEPTDLTDLDTHQNDEENIPYYSGYVYQIVSPNTESADIVIPYRASYGTRAYISVESIAQDVIDETSPFVTDAETGITTCRINSIYIPSTVMAIDPTAFEKLEGYNVTFKLGFDDYTQPYFDVEESFPEDAIIEYVGYASQDTSLPLTSPKTTSQDVDFIVGSEADYGSDEYPENMQLGLQYDVYSGEEYVRTVCEYFPVSSSTTNYDTIGAHVGRTNLTLYFDIELGEGETIDHESLIFFNLYYASNDGNGYYPDLHYTKTDDNGNVTTYGQLYCIPGLTFKVDDDIDNYINYSYNSLNTFSGYTSFVMNVEKADTNIYQELMSSIYNTNISSIEDGTYTIRYRFTSLATGYYRITYLNSNNELETINLKINTPVSSTSINTKRATTMSFLVKNKDVADDFNVKSVRKVELVGFRITLDLYNRSRNSILSKSSMETRFGIITLMDLTETQPSSVNYNMILLYITIGYIVLFLACAFGYYYYCKNRYKNDEFRRVNTSHFIRTAAIAFVMVGIILMAITFIILRAVPINNAIVTFNPTDVYVFFFSIFAIIAIGYYIRYFWLAGKARRHRKEVQRLRLNEDEEDDGTEVK